MSVVVRMEFRKNCLDCDLHQIVYGDALKLKKLMEDERDLRRSYPAADE